MNHELIKEIENNHKKLEKYRSKGNYQLISSIIDQYDPMNLLAHGAPDDEYKMEAFFVTKYLEDFDGKPTKEECLDVIYNIFVKCFTEGIVGSKDNYKTMVQDILDKI